MRIKTELGYLKRGDFFYIGGVKYKVLFVGNRSYNNVCCQNVETKRRIWFDVTTDVEYEE